MQQQTFRRPFGAILLIAGMSLLISLSWFAAGWQLREARGMPQRSHNASASNPWKGLLDSVVSETTAEALAHDEQLRRRYLEIIDLTTDLSRNLARRYQVPRLAEATSSLERYRKQLGAGPGGETAQPRGLAKRLFGIGDSPSSNDSSNPLADLLSPITDALSGFGDSIKQDLVGSAMFLGIGIGAGAAQGLQLAPANTTKAISAKVAADNGMDATGLNPAIESLGMGAAASLLGSVNLSSLAGGVGSLGPIARSLAEGIGNGTVAGLKLTDADLEPPPNGTGFPDAAANFGFGLSKAVASSVNISAIAGSVPSVDLGSVAQGFARGFVQGAGDAVQSIGGIPALLNGTAHAPLSPVPDGTVAFNDSIGGAATGFGQGLGGQLVLVARQLLDGVKIALPGASAARRSVLFLSPSGIAARQSSDAATNSSGLNISALVNSATLSAAGQVSVGALTCQGVGGLAGVVLGLVKSGAIPLSQMRSDTDASDLAEQVAPGGIIRITNAGNTYDVDAKQISSAGGSLTAAAGGLYINGRSAMAFVAFLLVHIVLAVLAFLHALPLAVGLESARNMLVRVRLGHVLPNASRWNNMLWFFVVAPALVLVLVFGALVVGSAAHLRTAHGILGLILLLVGILAVSLHVFVKTRGASDPLPTWTKLQTGRAVVNHVLLLLAVATSMTGFVDLSTVSLCFTQILSMETSVMIGFGLAGPFTLGSGLAGLDAYLAWRAARRPEREKDQKE